MEQHKTYSLSKIASELGVSKAAVSFVMNRTAREHRIGREMEQRIYDFCVKVGYRPNVHARRMNQRIVKNIGIMIDRQTAKNEISPFTEYNISHAIAGIAQEADEVGFRFSFQFYSPGMDIDKVFEWHINRDIDGIIYYGFAMPNEWLEMIRSEKFNVVGISIDPAYGLPCVNVNNYDASFQLTEYLTGRGHRKFLYLTGSEESYPARERFCGFKAALSRADIDFSNTNRINTGFSEKTAGDFIRERMKDIPGYDAVVCANDAMAIGVMNALKEAGISIPEQIAVAGADNIEHGRIITPSLTTFDNLMFKQGRKAFKLLHNLLYTGNAGDNILLKTILKKRNSA